MKNSIAPSSELGTENIQQGYSTATKHQRQRLLNQLRLGPLSTLQARAELDILHPAARVQELRSQGHNIATHWQTVDSGKAQHRVAEYILLPRET